MGIKDKVKRKAYYDKHYATYKQRYLDRNRRKRSRLREYVHKQKHMKPCTDCGSTYPYYVMDFDHLRDKKYGRTYWLGVLSRYSKKKNKEPEVIYTHLLGLLKEGRTMDSKYSKGGWLTNKFSK